MNKEPEQNIYNQQDEGNEYYEQEDFNIQQQVEVIGTAIQTHRNKQFDITYNNEDYQSHRQQQQPKKQQTQSDDEDDDDNPMAKKLKQMKQQLRNQIQNDESKEEVFDKKRNKEEDEDNQGYDAYKSPQHKFALQNPINKEEEERKEKQQPAIGQQVASGNVLGVANFDKIKNSKLFQKFLQKETSMKSKEEQKPTQLKNASSKTSLQQQNSITPLKQSSGDKQRKQWLGQKQQKQNSQQMDNLNLTQQTHDDFYQSKMKVPKGKEQQKQHMMPDPNIDFSIEGGIQNNQFLDDSQFFQNPVQQLENIYYNHTRPTQDNKAYLLDNSELCNEGELIGYSEQILGKINDMAPGVPNQDEVLYHQPPENFVNMMHEQFNNEMPWLIQNAQSKQDQSRELPFSNAPQQFDYQNVEPVRKDMYNMREEMMKMKNDYSFVNDRFTNLKEKYDKLLSDYQKDKTFYEEALEIRMKQLEQLEQDNEVLNKKLEEAHRREMNLQSQLDQEIFDKDMMKRNLNSNNQTKDALSKKEEELYSEIRQLQEQLREKEFEHERFLNDQQKLSSQLERQNQEMDRLRQQFDYQEQALTQKDSEKQMIVQQVNDFKQRLQQEQTDQHYLRNENEELKNEVMMLKQQVNMSNNVQEQLRQQLFEMKDRMNEIEHREFLANSTKDLMQREIQQLRMQLNQANQFIQQQAMFYTQAATQGNLQKPPVFQVQPTNWDQYQEPQMNRNANNYEALSTQSRESAVPMISPHKKSRTEANLQKNSNSQSYAYGAQAQAQNHQLRSNNVSTLLQWDEQPLHQIPSQRQNTKRQQITESGSSSVSNRQLQQPEQNFAFPSQSFMDQQQQESNIVFPSRQAKQQQQETNIPFPSRQGKQQQEETNVAFPSRQQNRQANFESSSQKSFDQSSQSDRNTSKIQQKNLQSTVMNKGGPDQKQKQLQNIEGNLLQLNLERDRFKSEFDKIPENAKTIAQRRRKEELERELDILNKNIGSLKTKLRDLEALH